MLRLGVLLVSVLFFTACSSTQGIKADDAFLSSDVAKTMISNGLEENSSPDAVDLSPFPKTNADGALVLSLSKKNAWSRLQDYFNESEIPVLASDRDLGVFFLRANAIVFEGEPIAQGLLQVKLSFDEHENLVMSLLDIADQPFESKQKAALITALEQVLLT